MEGFEPVGGLFDPPVREVRAKEGFRGWERMFLGASLGIDVHQSEFGTKFASRK